jgi:hypothetical protein
MPDVKPRPSAGAIRRSVNSADQKGVGSGRATVTKIIAGHFFDITAATGPGIIKTLR